jgi:allantoin racemase
LKRRILVIVPLFVTREEATDIKKLLGSYAWDGTEIDVTGLQGNIAVNSRSEADIATPEFLDLAIKAEKNGYDAVISYCYLDVGVDVARELVNIPIIGPLEASAIVANMVGRRFSMISVGDMYPPGEFYILPRLRTLRLDRNYISTRGIGFEKFFVFSEDIRHIETMRTALMAECRKALADGAHVLILACTGFPPARSLGDELKVPIIDAEITLKVAEALIDLKPSTNESPVNDPCQEKKPTKMWIKLLIPTSADLEPNLLEKLMRFVNDGTEIDIVQFEKGPESIRSTPDVVEVVPFIIREAASAEREGYNAVVISSSVDPGLESAREMCEIPIMGLGESSMLLTCMLGMRFSVILYDGRVQPLIEKNVRKIGLEKRFLSVRSMDKQAKGKWSKLDSAKLFHEIEKAVDEGAQAIIVDEAAAFEINQSIQKKVKVPILNPLSVALKMAEVFHSINLSHSKLCYPKPILPQYHKRRLVRLNRKPIQSLFLYGENR